MAKDDVLISRAQAGDEQAFTDLVKSYHTFVDAIVSGVLDDLGDVEEVVQDAFINAYRGLPQLKDTASFNGWLAEIARNCTRNWLRKQRVDTVSIDEVSVDTLQTSESPDTQLIRAEQRELMRRAMETLSQKDREIARAYYLDGASYDELIRTHGLSYKAISFRLSRAKRTLTKRLRHLLSGVFVPPATTLKKISSGGLTVMKIGTVSKITVGVIAIIALAFFGSRQLLSPEEDSTPSVEVAASTTNKLDQPVAGIDATRRNVVTTPSRADEPQISAEEMGQIGDFFAQLDEADGQSKTGQLAEAEFQQDDDERGAGNTDALTENAAQSAEDVMNAFVAAFKNLDTEGMRPLMTGDMREYSHLTFGEEIIEMRVEERDGTEGVEHHVTEMVDELRQQNEQHMFEAIAKMINQTEIVDNRYVGDEFYFRIRVPLRIPVLDGMEFPEGLEPPESVRRLAEIIPESDILVYKMRKEDGAWRIFKQ